LDEKFPDSRGIIVNAYGTTRTEQHLSNIAFGNEEMFLTYVSSAASEAIGAPVILGSGNMQRTGFLSDASNFLQGLSRGAVELGLYTSGMTLTEGSSRRAVLQPIGFSTPQSARFQVMEYKNGQLEPIITSYEETDFEGNTITSVGPLIVSNDDPRFIQMLNQNTSAMVRDSSGNVVRAIGEAAPAFEFGVGP